MAIFSMGITEQLLDARSLWLTPNTTTVYCIAEINVEHGPTIMEVPPGVLGARPRQGILVVRRLLGTAPGPAGDRPEERRRRQPEPGPAGQPGRFLHRLVRTNRAHRQGGQLGADHARQELVGLGAPLRATRAVVRQVMETG